MLLSDVSIIALNSLSVTLSSFFDRGISVWLASQTRMTITIRGKSALRKNRFMRPQK
jgi:hypothetical protein